MRFIGNDPNILNAFYKATADGSIAAGKPVIVTAPASSVGSAVDFESGATKDVASVYDSSNNRIVVAYMDDADGDNGKAVVGTVSGSSITFGTPVTFESATTQKISIAFDSNANKVVIAYEDFENSSYGTAIVGTVDPSDNSISFGSAAVFESAAISGDAAYVTFSTFDSSNNKVVICYNDNGNSDYMTAVVGTVSGTSISFGTPVVFESANGGGLGATFDSNANKVVIAFRDGGDSDKGKGIVGTVSGTSISFGSATEFQDNARAGYGGAVFDSSNNKVVFNISASTDGGNNFKGLSFVGTVSGTSISFGSAATFETGEPKNISAAFDSGAGKVAVSYMDDADSDKGKIAIGTVSGTSITFQDPVTFESGAITQNTGTAFDSSAGRVVVSFADDGDSSKGKSVVIANDVGGKVKQIALAASDPPTKGSAGEFSSGAIGTFQDSVYDPDTDKIVVAYNATGSSLGRAAVGTVSGTSISFGTAAGFGGGTTAYPVVTYDTNSDKVVIAYEDNNNSNYGTAVVGTVSGTSISYGTPVVFQSSETTRLAITFDSTNNKVLIGYRNDGGSNHGQVAIGTVSGTSISFGSAEVFNVGNTTNIGMAFDSSNDKFVISYRDGSASSYGTAIVGTVSGSSMSFGTEVVFSGTNTVQYTSATFDSSNNKIVIAYRDDGNSAYGTAVVGTVSGTSISFGTPVVFVSSNTVYTDIAFDSSANQVGITWRDENDGSAGDFIVGTVSGTSISFGTSIELAGDVEQSAISYDSGSGQFVVSYHDDDDSSKGKAVVIATSETNLTTENYIGITDQAYTDGQDATIAVVGCIDRNQTSLTAGQQYFVQKDGTLALTAATPSVLAGTAISATELVVKE